MPQHEWNGQRRLCPTSDLYIDQLSYDSVYSRSSPWLIFQISPLVAPFDDDFQVESLKPLSFEFIPFVTTTSESIQHILRTSESHQCQADSGLRSHDRFWMTGYGHDYT